MIQTSKQRIPPPSAEAQARAILTYCIDSPNALLYAALLGAQSAQTLLKALRQLDPDMELESNQNSKQRNAIQALDEMFLIGSARWGHHAQKHDLAKFHKALMKWRSRLRTLTNNYSPDLLSWMTQNGSQWIIAPGDTNWPKQLNDLSIRSDWAPPLCLWGIGSQETLVSCSQPIAVVGSRDCNDYGRFIAYQVGRHAAAQGHVIISGGALGADANAHWGALNTRGTSNNGQTIAVFAGGLNNIGPKHNHKLFEAIEHDGGALISELCPSTIPEARRFLLRNRIIAALAHSVVIAQARHRSGAINTATWACELGRDVYAAPGAINTPENTGCNSLIHDGKAMILISVSNLEEITHAPHEPAFTSNATDPIAATRTSIQQHPKSAYPPLKGSSHSQLESKVIHQKICEPEQATIPDDTLTQEQQQLLQAINSCKSHNIEATCENIATILSKNSHVSTNELLQHVFEIAGEMELLDLIQVKNGIIQAHMK